MPPWRVSVVSAATSRRRRSPHRSPYPPHPDLTGLRRAAMNAGKSKRCGAATLFVVQDVLASVAHYRDVLGFTYGDPTFYAGVKRDEVTIHLQAAHATKRQVGQGAMNIF